MWLSFRVINSDRNCVRLHDVGSDDTIVFRVSLALSVFKEGDVNLGTGEKLSDLEGKLVISRDSSDNAAEAKTHRGSLSFSKSGEGSFGAYPSSYHIAYTARPSIFNELLKFIRERMTPKISVVLRRYDPDLVVPDYEFDIEGIEQHETSSDWDTENHRILFIYDLVFDFPLPRDLNGADT